jgi:hypothetical protein
MRMQEKLAVIVLFPTVLRSAIEINCENKSSAAKNSTQIEYNKRNEKKTFKRNEVNCHCRERGRG